MDSEDIPPSQQKITIATVTYNAGALISRTIRSVEEQDYAAIEHLIIDGNSNDDTLEQVHHYQERNSIAKTRHEVNCLSEPDNGLYDAMNKALQMAEGQYILFLNAGDVLHSATTISDIMRQVNDLPKQPGVIYGNTDIVDIEGRFIRHRRLAPSGKLTWKSFKSGMLVCHQAFIANTDLAKELPYDLKYRYSSDFDWCIRVMRLADRENMPLYYVSNVVSDFLQGGMTKQHHQASLNERFRIMMHHYGWFSTFCYHLWFVIRAFLKK
ncbi:MAG: glycosyltransferase [Bacteroidaceae bacterium]|nr:glycosyltransferase [Bacteroidaceae bacterium]